MIDLRFPPTFVADLAVFVDHADARVRYIAPLRPALTTVDDHPQIGLSLFRGDVEGGLLHLEAELAPTTEQMDALHQHAAAVEQPVFLPVDWVRGSAVLSGWLDSDISTPNSLTLTPPTLLGAPRCIAALRLDRQQAALALNTLTEAMLPSALIFELETLGLAGPLAVRARADRHALHERLTLKGALQAPMTRAQITATWEEALQAGEIELTVLDETLDADAARREAMQRVSEALIGDMLSAQAPAEAPAMLSDRPIAAVELSFRLTRRRESLQATALFDFSERRPVALRHYAAANLMGLLDPEQRARAVQTVDLVPSSRSVLVRTPPILHTLAISALQIDVRADDTDTAQQTLVLDDADHEAQLHTRQPWDAPLAYRVQARYDAAQTRAESARSDWLSAEGGTLVVFPERLFPQRTTDVSLGSGETDWLDHVKVVLEPDGQPPRALTLDETHRRALLAWPGVTQDTVPATVHWRGRASEPSHSRTEQIPMDQPHFIDSPFGASIRIFAVPLPQPGLISIVLEVRYGQDDMAQHRTVAWDGADRAPADLALRRLRGHSRTYEYRVTSVQSNGHVTQDDWISTQTSQLVLGAAVATVVRRLKVVLPGTVAGRGALAVELVLSDGANSVSQVLDADVERGELVLVTEDEQRNTVLRVTEFLPDGRTHTVQIDNPDDLVVIAPQAQQEDRDL